MSESFICRRGGSGTPFAVIGVTYPAGSTCTCTNGTKTLKAKNTSGTALFVIPSAATWTVTCTDDEDIASQEVSITTEGQTETVALSYDLILIGDGNTHEDVTGGWANTGTYTLTLTDDGLTIAGHGGGNTGYIYPNNFDPALLDSYSTVSMTYTLSRSVATQITNKLQIASGKSTTGATVIAETGNLELSDTPITVTLDISNVNNGYIRLLCGQVTAYVISDLRLKL